MSGLVEDVPPPPRLPSPKQRRQCLEQLQVMDRTYRMKQKQLHNKIEAQTKQIDELRDANHYLLEQNRRLLMTVNLMRLRSPSAPPILRSNSANLSVEFSEEKSQLLKF